MKGIYITEEFKKELETKIAELKNEVISQFSPGRKLFLEAKLKVYEEILSSAIVLPVEESWGKCRFYGDKVYPNGVVFQPK